MRRVKLIILATAAAFTSTAQPSTDYDRIISMLVADCPEIKQLVAANEAETESKAAENMLENPSVDAMHAWSHNNVGNKIDAGISQGFAWPGVYRARAKAINASTRAADLLEQSTVADKILQIEQLVIDIVYQRKTIDVENKILAHMTKLEKGNLDGFRQGELTMLDVKKVEIQRISAASSLREAKRILDDLYAQLESVTGNKECRALLADITAVPEEQILPEEEYEKLIDTYDPRLAWLRAQSEAFNLEGKAAVMSSRTPEFSLGYKFIREGGEVFNGISGSMTLPIYSRRHIANSARANALSAQIEAEASHMSAIAGMRALHTSVTSMKKELDDYINVFGDNNYAQLLATARQGGQLDNLRYLEELNFFLEAARAYLSLEHEFMRSLAQLNRFKSIEERS